MKIKYSILALTLFSITPCSAVVIEAIHTPGVNGQYRTVISGQDHLLTPELLPSLIPQAHVATLEQVQYLMPQAHQHHLLVINDKLGFAPADVSDLQTHPAQVLFADLKSPAQEIMMADATGNLVSRVNAHMENDMPDLALAQIGAVFDGLRWSHDFGAVSTPYPKPAFLTRDHRGLIKLGSHGQVQRWDVATGQLRDTLPITSLYLLDMSADRRFVFSYPFPGYDENIQKWDLKKGMIVREFKLPRRQEPSYFSVSPDGRYLAVGQSHNKTLVFNAATGKLLSRLDQTTDAISTIFSPDGKYSFSSKSRTDRYAVIVNEVHSGKFKKTFPGHLLIFARHPLVPKSRTPFLPYVIAAQISGVIQLLDTEKGKKLKIYDGHSHPVSSMALSPGASRLAAGTSDGSVTVWGANSGALLRRFERPAGSRGQGSIATVAFSKDGATVLAISDNGVVEAWDAP